MTITDYDTIGTGALEIVDTLGGFPVTSIGSSAFQNCSSLTSVTIPDSVTSIGDDAFFECTGLTSVTIGNSVTSIGGYAFQRCSSLISVTIPDSVTSIGDFAFHDCTSLTSITIGNSVTSIGVGAFFECTGLTSITIPDSVISIGASAFNSCSSLTSIVIPDSVTSIGVSAFNSCSSLTSAIIGNGVTSIGGFAFNSCSSLTSAIIGNGVTSIGAFAFRYCTGLTSITIPNSVTSIGNEAFRGCSNLASILLEPMAAPTIASNAFSHISSAAIINYPLGATGYAASYGGVPTAEGPPPVPESPVLDIGDFYESSAGVSVVVSAIPTAGYPTNFSYQWYFNGFIIPSTLGGTASSLTIDGISGSNGTWRVVVTNDGGSTEASFEYRVFADSDSDGLSDYRESNITNTNPSLADTDSDGLNDFVEVNTTLTDPNDSDSDDDTILDGIEVRHATFGFDPAVDSSARLAALIALVEEFPGVSTDAQNNSLSLGGISLTPSGGNSLSVDFIIEESEDLSSWTTVDTVSHSLDTSDTKKFIRVRKP